jgi:hypothetical protein
VILGNETKGSAEPVRSFVFDFPCVLGSTLGPFKPVRPGLKGKLFIWNGAAKVYEALDTVTKKHKRNTGKKPKIIKFVGAERKAKNLFEVYVKVFHFANFDKS